MSDRDAEIIAAEAIADVMGTTLLLAWSGETFLLSAAPIWVRPVAVALSLAQGGAAGRAAGSGQHHSSTTNQEETWTSQKI